MSEDNEAKVAINLGNLVKILQGLPKNWLWHGAENGALWVTDNDGMPEEVIFPDLSHLRHEEI